MRIAALVGKSTGFLRNLFIDSFIFLFNAQREDKSKVVRESAEDSFFYGREDDTGSERPGRTVIQRRNNKTRRKKISRKEAEDCVRENEKLLVRDCV